MQFLIRLCAIALIPALTTTVCATGENLDQHVRQFVVDRYHDGRRLIEGPREITPPLIEPDQSCVELYQRRLTLLRRLHDYQPAYWDDPRNQAAVFLGAIWTPAFYFLGYTAVNARLDEIDDIDPRAELDALRYASARARCFEK